MISRNRARFSRSLMVAIAGICAMLATSAMSPGNAHSRSFFQFCSNATIGSGHTCVHGTAHVTESVAGSPDVYGVPACSGQKLYSYASSDWMVNRAGQLYVCSARGVPNWLNYCDTRGYAAVHNHSTQTHRFIGAGYACP